MSTERQAVTGSQATQPDPLEKLTRLQEDMGLYDEATQPTQAQAPSEREAWPVMPPSKGQSPILFEDGYAEGWAKCLAACQEREAALSTQQAGQGEAVGEVIRQHLPSGPPHWGEEYMDVNFNEGVDLPSGTKLYTTPPAPQQPEVLAQQERDREDAIDLLKRASESIGGFVSDHGWAQSDMDTMDAINGYLARAARSSEGGAT